MYVILIKVYTIPLCSRVWSLIMIRLDIKLIELPLHWLDVTCL